MTLFARLKRIARTHGPRLFEREASPGAPFEKGRAHDEPNRRRHAASSAEHQPPPERERRDPELARYYANLEVPYGADLETVRAAYRRLMKRYHPDRHAGDPERRRLARRITQGLNEAYRALSRELKVER